MPIVGVRPANLARSLRAEAITSRLAGRAQVLPSPAARPGAHVEPPTTVGTTVRPPMIVLPVPTQFVRPAEQEPARAVIRAYQATRDTALPLQPSPQVSQPDVVPFVPASARAAAREDAERPAARDDAADQRPGAQAVAGVIAAGVSVLSKPFGALSAEASTSRRAQVRGDAGRRTEQPIREGGWTEAITLLTIVAIICLGVWLLL